MPDEAEAQAREVRRLDRRLRRQKLVVERINPVERAVEHAEAFERLLELEATLRTLRDAPVTPHEDAGVDPT